MMFVFRWLYYRILGLLLASRYRVRIIGAEALSALKGPILILPNHPALVDPFLVMTTFWPRTRVRPLVWGGSFRGLSGKIIIKLMNALVIPELDVASAAARGQAEDAVRGVAEGLKRGENFALWPSGKVQRDGIERVGAARAAADVLRQAPDATVVLLRTRGVWGSSFSWAQTASGPNVIKRLLIGALWIIANLIFFMPRRRVSMTLRVVKSEELPAPTREAVNPWLEGWYNEDHQSKGETPTYVPYHFLFGRRTWEFPPPPSGVSIELKEIPAATREAVVHLLEEHLERSLTEKEIKAETTLDALGLDSLDQMEVALAVERRFGFSSDSSPTTLGQLFALAQGLAERKPPRPPTAAWFAPRRQTEPMRVLDETIGAAFVARALANPKDAIVADDLSGVLSYERMLVAALCMAKRLRTIETENVGLLLPASVGGDIAFYSLHLAGKLPVILNWTTGPANLEHAARLMKLSVVVTSKAFIDRTQIVVGGTKYLFLEELRASIGKFELLRTLLRVRWFSGGIVRQAPRPDPDKPALVLFTSGSEKAPKAVPLTHRNILTNVQQVVDFTGVRHTDVLLGFLPMFHSFGMTVTGQLPLLGGMRVVRHPDPTDAASLARKAAAYKITILAGTPTFVMHILERVKPGELASLRMIVTGAEKAPTSLFDRCRELAPEAVIVEGYGVTECSPAVAVNPPEAPRLGSIGKPLAQVNLEIRDLETGEALPPGKMGMIEVSGPAVFPGYLSHEGDSPFVERDGKRWYVTGDLGEFDADGYLWFKGRLKRFLKAGGEMISLPALEEPFAKAYPPTEDGPRVAVEGVEHEGARRIVLFTTEEITLREANARLVADGFHGVMRLDEVKRVDKIPTLGTGKTDYKVLRAEVEKQMDERTKQQSA